VVGLDGPRRGVTVWQRGRRAGGGTEQLASRIGKAAQPAASAPNTEVPQTPKPTKLSYKGKQGVAGREEADLAARAVGER